MKYFTIEELTRSKTAEARGIKNVPNEAERLNLIALVGAVLDPLRERYGKPIIVTSGYRCKQLNKSVGGVTSSQHVRGEAADIVTKEGARGNFELGRLIVQSGKFDQVIFENCGKNDLLPQWIHVSWKRTGALRGNVLKKIKGEKIYRRVSRDEILN
jgi:hypothetical protein